jgi:hypothetical protein
MELMRLSYIAQRAPTAGTCMARDRAWSTVSRSTAAACPCTVLKSPEISLLTRVVIHSGIPVHSQQYAARKLKSIALFLVVCTLSLFIHSTRWHHKFRTCSEVGADGILAMIARNSAGSDSRGRSGAGRFLSNFEPIMNVSEGAVKAL